MGVNSILHTYRWLKVLPGSQIGIKIQKMLDLSMTKTDFLYHFTGCFHHTPPEAIQWDTRFRELEEWGSMLALIVLSMLDAEYNCLLSPDTFRKAVTVEDLYLLVKEKQL